MKKIFILFVMCSSIFAQDMCVDYKKEIEELKLLTAHQYQQLKGQQQYIRDLQSNCNKTDLKPVGFGILGLTFGSALTVGILELTHYCK